MLLVSTRKVPRRLPVVPPLSEVEALIAAARDPFELAVVEVLYATGVRRAELVSLRVEDICWPIGDGPGSIRVKNGKGGKDRVVNSGGTRRKQCRSISYGDHRRLDTCLNLRRGRGQSI